MICGSRRVAGVVTSGQDRQSGTWYPSSQDSAVDGRDYAIGSRTRSHKGQSRIELKSGMLDRLAIASACQRPPENLRVASLLEED